MHLFGIEEEILHRRVNPAEGVECIAHTYPFNTFPIFESHLHPKFVIFNAGRKLNFLQIRVQNLVNESVDSASLNSVMKLYDAWLRPPPDVKDESYDAPVDECTTDEDDSDDDIGDEDDEDYNGRATSSKKRKVAAKTVGKRKRMRTRKVLSTSSSYNRHFHSKLPLSRLNLSRHDQETIGDGSCNDSILDWQLKSCRIQKKFQERIVNY